MEDFAGTTVYLIAPFDRLQAFSSTPPEIPVERPSTRGVFIVPKWKGQPWRRLLQNFTEIQRFLLTSTSSPDQTATLTQHQDDRQRNHKVGRRRVRGQRRQSTVPTTRTSRPRHTGVGRHEIDFYFTRSCGTGTWGARRVRIA